MNKQHNDSIIRTRDLSKFYPNSKTNALRQAQVSIAGGEFVSITGPSGSGKTTFLNIIAGLIEPTQGEIFFRDLPYAEIKNKSLFRRKNIGFIFQDFYLYPGFTALENILIGRAHSLFTPRSWRTKAKELLSYLNMAAKAADNVNTLSTGERQRICIARALMHEPCIILADEPTGSLDTQNSKLITDILKAINAENGTTIIIATHDQHVAAYAHRNITIEDGLLH